MLSFSAKVVRFAARVHLAGMDGDMVSCAPLPFAVRASRCKLERCELELSFWEYASLRSQRPDPVALFEAKDADPFLSADEDPLTGPTRLLALAQSLLR